MKLSAFIHYLTVEPIKLSLREKCLAVLTCLGAIWLTSGITQFYAPINAPILIASMGASAVILFIIPSSPLAQPWPFVGGHLVSGLTGLIINHYQSDLTIAAALAIGLAVLMMILLRCLHPPGAATALAPILSTIHQPIINFEFLWLPLGINILIMLGLAVLINRFILKHSYPLPIPTSPLKSQPDTSTHLINIDEADVEKALSDLNLVVDIGDDELRKILTHLQLSSLQKNLGKLSCGDIMAENITTIGYDTTVETAWNLILDKQLKALPVLDQSQRVIGIVTRQDFLKNINLTSYAKLEKRWLTFIKPSMDIKTNKPEFIGHIMNKKVKTLTSDADITKLLPLMLEEGHHQIPIVNHKHQLIGMVFENQLTTALFNQLVLNQVIS
jgi:CBS domain-containing membrane protein